MKKPRILFICKKNECYSFVSYTRRSSGLYNSTRFIVDSLNKHGIQSKIIEVQDNNDIDREVYQYKPTAVVIEALWVVPEKFDVLMKLHLNVSWYVHLHSHIPFLAHEGIAMDWINGYAERGVGMIANSAPSWQALRVILDCEELVYLPNVYISHPHTPVRHGDREHIHIACMGAVRPMKNQLLQALAAIQFARDLRKPLKFYINGTRTEIGGEQVLKNIRGLFRDLCDATLVEDKWNEPEEFIHKLRNMDIGMQVSMTETFNVVCADYVTAGIPVVASKEVAWISQFCKAKDDDIEDIVAKMHRVYRNRCLVKHNQRLLLKNSQKAQSMWAEFAASFNY